MGGPCPLTTFGLDARHQVSAMMLSPCLSKSIMQRRSLRRGQSQTSRFIETQM